MERWLPVPGYEGWYEVSNYGRVRKIRRSVKGHANTRAGKLPHIMAPLIYRKGYIKTHFASCDGTKPEKRVFVHRLVWEAFNGPIPDGLTINHKDGDKANNHLDNLEPATHLQQSDHAASIGLTTRKMTPALAAEVRELYATGAWTYWQLAGKYGVSETLIAQYVKPRAWSGLHRRWLA